MTQDYYTAKTDKGKTRHDLTPPEWIEGPASVLTMGAEIYGENTWQTVPDGIKRYTAACMRHFLEYRRGIKVNGHGFHPMLQVAVNALFIYSLDLESERQKKEVPMK
jgi:hypothetical protein